MRTRTKVPVATAYFDPAARTPATARGPATAPAATPTVAPAKAGAPIVPPARPVVAPH